MKKIFITIIVCIFLSTTVMAGPFGTNMGDTKEKYSNLVKGNSYNNYLTGIVPQKHEDFLFYSLVFSQKYGLVKITAISHPIENDNYGDKAKELFSKIRGQLRNKYGKEKNFYDFLNHGSIWKEPKYWSMGIRKNERTYSAFWDINNNEDNVKSILLKVVSGENQNAISLSYEYIDAKKYFDEKEKDSADAL